MYGKLYTPQEIAAIRANNERAQIQSAMEAQRMNTGLNIAQNLSPLGSLGFLLGTLGGRLANNYFERGDMKRIEEANRKYNNQMQLFSKGWQEQTKPLYALTPNEFANRLANETGYQPKQTITPYPLRQVY